MSLAIVEDKCDYFLIRGAEALDPITVVLRDAGPSCGELIVSCYGRAWSAYWGAMGTNSVREFVRICGPDYIVNKLTDYSRKQTKKEEQYLERIVDAVKKAIEESLE